MMNADCARCSRHRTPVRCACEGRPPSRSAGPADIGPIRESSCADNLICPYCWLVASFAGLVGRFLGGLLGGFVLGLAVGKSKKPPTPPAKTGFSVVPETVQLFNDETTESYKHLIEVITNYRSNTTVILALATGATTFFGFTDAPKGPGYAAALGFFAVSAILAALVFWPNKLQTNMVPDYRARLFENGAAVSVARARYVVLGRRQLAMVDAEAAIKRISRRFRLLIVTVALTILSAGINVAVEKSEPTPPTHIVIDG
jgi:hypothetical protein